VCYLHGYLAKRLFFGKLFYYLKSQIFMRDVVTELRDNNMLWFYV